MLLDEYTLTQFIGKGTFGEVYLTKKQNSDFLFATKRMSKEFVDDPKYTKYFNNEITILKKLYHKNIIKLEALKKTTHHYYVIMEYCNGGTLTECLEKYKNIYHKPFTEEIVQYIMRQVVSAINYIHSLRIIHRDLKLDNILVKFENESDKTQLNLLKAEIKIIDFGFAAYKDQKGLLQTAIGSPMNMDPLILKKFNSGGTTNKELGYDEKADIWSLGTLCYQMLIGNCAFDAFNMKELVSKIEEGTYKVPTNLSKEVVSFLNGMLQYNPEKRLSASELIKHAFLIKNVSDFTRIDINQVSKKVYGGELKINIRENNTIWSIFNEDDEKKLNNIPGEFFPSETPISESQYLGDLGQNNANNQLLISKDPFNLDKNFIDNAFKPANSTPIDNNLAFGRTNSAPIPEGINQPNNAQIPKNNLVQKNINQEIMRTPIRQKNPMPIFQNNININNNYISKTPQRGLISQMKQPINQNNMITIINKLKNGQIVKAQIPLEKFKEMQQKGQIGKEPINMNINQKQSAPINKIIPNNLNNQMNAMIHPPINLPHGQMQFGVSPHMGDFQKINNNQNPNFIKLPHAQIQRNNTAPFNLIQKNPSKNNINFNNQNQNNLILNRQIQNNQIQNNNQNIIRQIQNNQIQNNSQNINRQITNNQIQTINQNMNRQMIFNVVQNNQHLNKAVPNNIMQNNKISNNIPQNNKIPKNIIQNPINMNPQNRIPLSKNPSNNIPSDRIINNSDLSKNQKSNIQSNQLSSKQLLSNNTFQGNQINQPIQNRPEDQTHKAIRFGPKKLLSQPINSPRSPLLKGQQQILPQNIQNISNKFLSNHMKLSPQRQFERNAILANQQVQQVKAIPIPVNGKRIYSGKDGNTFSQNMIQNPNNLNFVQNISNNGQIKKIPLDRNTFNNNQIQRGQNLPIRQERKLSQAQLRLIEQNSKNQQNITIPFHIRNGVSPIVQRIAMRPILTLQNNHRP